MPGMRQSSGAVWCRVQEMSELRICGRMWLTYRPHHDDSNWSVTHWSVTACVSAALAAILLHIHFVLLPTRPTRSPSIRAGPLLGTVIGAKYHKLSCPLPWRAVQ